MQIIDQIIHKKSGTRNHKSQTGRQIDINKLNTYIQLTTYKPQAQIKELATHQKINHKQNKRESNNKD